MRISSARQIEMDLGGVASPNARTTFTREASAEEGSILDMPTFQAPERVEAARMAGRMNAASTSSYELNALLAERSTLLDKKFNGSMSKSEANRLELVRWSIDRIEDARFGFELDHLETMTERYEQLMTSLQKLGEQISKQTRAPSGGRRGRSQKQ